MTLLYIGDGSYIPGVPARNLTAEEVATHDKASLLATGLYKEPATADYEALKVDELRELAKEAGIDEYAKMKKTELIEALSGDD